MPAFLHDRLVDPTRTLWQVQHGFSDTDFNGLTYKQVMAGQSRAGMTIDDLWPSLGNVDDAQQFIADMIHTSGRLTMQRNIRLDPTRPKWARVCGPKPCAFCLMLASRGFAYNSKDTATFGSSFHDGHCHCTIIPSWGKDDILLKKQAEWDEMYQTAKAVAASPSFKGTVLTATRMIYGAGLSDGSENAIPMDSDLVKTLSKEDIGAILQKLSESRHVKTAKVWKKHFGQYRVVESTNTGTAEFAPAKNGISIDLDNLEHTNDGHAPYQTFFHETGHMLDWVKGNGRRYHSQIYRDANGNDLAALIREDGQEAFEQARKKAWPAVQQKLESLYKGVARHGYAEIRHLRQLADLGIIDRQDIITYAGNRRYGSLVLNIIDDALFEEYVDAKMTMKILADEIHGQGKGTDFDVDDILEYALGDEWFPYSWMKHPIGYFKYLPVEAEAFAEMLSAQLANENAWTLFQRYFPRSVRMYEDIIRRLAND